MERNPDYPEELYFAWEEGLEEAAEKFNEKSTYIRVELRTLNGVTDAYNDDIERDLTLIPIALGVVAFYIVVMVGSCSPIHCRVVAGIFGIICIALAYAAGCSVMFMLGGKASGIHNLLPCLLIGIGADDIFVIASAIDATPFSKSANERIIDGMRLAGPSITISTLSIAAAFYLASLTSLIALKSFC